MHVLGALLLGKTALLGLVLELEHDQQCFEEAEKADGKQGCESPPKHHVHRNGGLIGELHVKRQAQDKETENKDREDGRSVASIDEAIAQTATFAIVAQLQHVLEKPPLAAPRTSRKQYRRDS